MFRHKVDLLLQQPRDDLYNMAAMADVRSVIRFLRGKKGKPSDIHRQLEVYNDLRNKFTRFSSTSLVRNKWCDKF